MIIIGGGGLRSDFNQKVGRAVRINDRGFARVFAFFHLSNKYLFRHSCEQLKAVVDIGYPVKMICDKKIISGEQFIKSRYKILKNVKSY